MIKLGVYRPSQYTENNGRTWPRRTRLAYHLLRTSIPPSSAEIEMFEGIMPHVHLSAGVYRTTARERFKALDLFLAPILEAQFDRNSFSAQNPLLVEDWAASACITSVEWFESLQKSFPGVVRLAASDLHLYLIEIQLPGGASYIVEAGGQPLQYVKPPFVIPLSRPESALLAVNRWLQKRARREFEALKKRGGLKSIRPQEDREEWREDAVVFRRIPLIHPQALALRRANAAFTVEPHSLFEALPKPCHVIRTMNILNLSYFDQDRLMDGVRNVWHSLQMKGVWMVGRTIQERTGETPPLNHASVFEKTSTGFRLIDRHCAPSEIEELGLAFQI